MKEVFPVTENHEQRHQFEWAGRHRWRCRVCQWTWSTRRQTACPGVPRYAYGAWPPTLHPAGELRRLGRDIPPTPDGCAYQLPLSHWLWLYADERQVAPYVYSPPKTFRQRLRAFFERGPLWCQVCGYEDLYHGTIVDGLCRTCRFQRSWCQQVLDIRFWAQQMLQDEHTVLLDTETTGLGDRDVVIELALLSASNRELLYNSLIRPHPSASWSVPWRDTLLLDRRLQTAPTFHQVWRDVQPILKGYQTVISYGAAFHHARLEWTAQLYGYQLPPLKWECLMTRYAVFYGQMRLYDKQSPYQWQPLYRACRQQGTTPSFLHKAAEHAKAARRLLRAIAEKEGQHWDASR
jgi:DNA polymerase III epsilon subunit-like protein